MTRYKYPIRAVAELTGVSVDSIRAWERRYGAVKPERTRGGRLFSEAEIHRLRLLKTALGYGHSIGGIARLSSEELEKLIPETNAPASHQNWVEGPILHPDIALIMDHLQAYDGFSADRALGRLATMLTPREFVYTILTPLLQLVGREWAAKRLSVAQEHLLSACMRNILGTMVRLHADKQQRHKLIFATLPGEYHEFGILSAAMLAVAAGLQVVYLGLNLPVPEIAPAVRKTKSVAVVVGSLVNRPKERLLTRQIKQLCKSLPDGVPVLLGGNVPQSVLNDINNPRVTYLPSLSAFEEQLKGFTAIPMAKKKP